VNFGDAIVGKDQSFEDRVLEYDFNLSQGILREVQFLEKRKGAQLINRHPAEGPGPYSWTG
jgi:hypothetical protein